MSAINEQLRTVTMFVAELRRAGVNHVCISPGSRSTPLTIAFARHGDFKIWTLLDERSAGFFALGLARVRREPVVLVCTSGTAVANYMPAVMEAYHSRVPLLVLTADRPPELREVGSNQTVDQVKVYGTHVKWSYELPVPEATQTLMAHVRATAARVVHVAMSQPTGPVHLNWPFREPLIPPIEDEQDISQHVERADIHTYRGYLVPPAQAMSDMHAIFAAMKRGLIVCGPQDDPQFPVAVAALASTLGIPVLADPLSQVRTGTHDTSLVIDQYDLLFRAVANPERFRPDVILRFGQVPTSKALGQFISQQTQARQIVIDVADHWRDPFFRATDIVQADPVAFCETVAAERQSQTRSAWTLQWLQLNEKLSLLPVPVRGSSADEVLEIGLFPQLQQLLPSNALLFVGNSMPVRELDTFWHKGQGPSTILANRGASGIDGVISSAIGAAAGHDGPTLLVIGDVSFFHDLNGLYAGRTIANSLTIVLVHNDGGGIFSFLPQATHPDTFAYFGTPHGMDFADTIKMHGGSFDAVTEVESFSDVVTQRLAQPGLHVVQVRTNSSETVQNYRNIVEQAKQLIEDFA